MEDKRERERGMHSNWIFIGRSLCWLYFREHRNDTEKMKALMKNDMPENGAKEEEGEKQPWITVIKQ